MEVLRSLSTTHPTIANTYGKLVGMAENQVELPSASSQRAAGEKRSLEEMDAEILQYEEGLRRIQGLGAGSQMPTAEATEGPRSGRWRRWEGPWIDRPLGVVA